MKCFLCGRNEKKVMLLKLPIEALYENEWLEIVGNVRPNEYICLPCVGFQYDELERSKIVKKLSRI